MAPNISDTTPLFLAETKLISPQSRKFKPQATAAVLQTRPVLKQSDRQSKPDNQYQWDIVWRNVILFLCLHTAATYGLYLFIFHAHPLTMFWGFILGATGALGVTAGAHRLWAHKAYKAKWPMRLMLATFQTIALQNHIHEWVRDHRVHHKFTDTDADPHNSRRGFFFSHIGWLMVRKHKDVKEKGKMVDLSDIEQDWVVMLQKKYYMILLPLLCVIFPVWVPCYFWGEDFSTSWYCAGILRYTLSLNFTWFVNSIAHMWGMKPYDKNISAVENGLVAFLSYGEGWHNYHHAFPWDYKAAELGNYRLNLSTALIDLCAKLGLAYDLKVASKTLIERRAQRTGDGSHGQHEYNHHDHYHEHDHENLVWGWDDKSMTQEDIKLVDIFNKCDY